MQQDLPDILFDDRVQSFELCLVEFGTARCVDSQDFHFAVREEQVLHLDQDLHHYTLLLGVVEYVVVRLESPFVGNVFQDDRFAVFRTDRVEIQVGQRRNTFVNLCEQVFIDFGECRTADEFENVFAGADDIAVQLDHRVG